MITCVKKKLEVFISSKQDEFKRKRKEVEKLILKHPYLESRLLERRGANAEDPTNASVKAVRKSDIYIGIFGEKYSETAVKEYREAVKQRMPALLYLKKIKNREEKLTEFFENEIKSNFKFHEFKSCKKLLEQIDEDLNEFIYGLLEDGLQSYKSRKEKVVQVTEDTTKKVQTIKKKESDTYNNFFNAFLKKEDYLHAVLGSSTYIEGLVKEIITKLWDEKSDLRNLLGWSLHRLLDSSLINSNDLKKINEIRYIRSDAVHRGEKISKDQADLTQQYSKEIIKKLSKIISNIPSLDELIKKLEKSESYTQSISLAHMINKHKEFSRKQINTITRIYLENDEVHNSYLATPIILNILNHNKKKLDQYFYDHLFGKYSKLFKKNVRR